MARFLGSSIFEITVIPPTKKISKVVPMESIVIRRGLDGGTEYAGLIVPVVDD